MTPNFKPGTRVSHEKFGLGLIAQRDGDRIKVNFGVAGSRWLVTAIAAPVMKVTGFREPNPSSLPLQGPKSQAKTNRGSIRDPYVVRDRDEWDRENTIPNTRFYRTGRH
jgi:hypothetical protein